MTDILIAPSMLAGDFSRMGEEALRMERAGADWLHLDVMDGHFVPNITFGAPIIKALRPRTKLFFDVHLMIAHPERFIDDFLAAGADMITMHIEAMRNAQCSAAAMTAGSTMRILDAIHAAGKQAGLSVKPGTPVEAVFPWLERVDMILVMTVEPGFGGQAFMADMLPKVSALREEITRRAAHQDAPDIIIQVDGGISESTIGQAARAGANCFVAGSAVFKAGDAKAAIQALRLAAN